MQSRKENSANKKFESIPKDYSELIESKLKEFYAEYLNNKELTLKGHIYPEEVLLQISLKENDRLKHDNFLGSIEHSTEKKNTLDKMHILMDAVASMLDQHLKLKEDEVMDFPEDWMEFDFESEKVWLKYHSTNEDLEALANELLGEEFLKSLEDIAEESIGKEFFEETKSDNEEVSTSDSMNIEIKKSDKAKTAFDFFHNRQKSDLSH